ncbi:MAG: hypothetical protein LVQ64_04605, partial [Thermoplasmatales archaeon]|nr:hypothetical protein [Thermoplasmatales archaeon]
VLPVGSAPPTTERDGLRGLLRPCGRTQRDRLLSLRAPLGPVARNDRDVDESGDDDVRRSATGAIAADTVGLEGSPDGSSGAVRRERPLG